MAKIWQISEKAGKALAGEYPDTHPVILQLLYNRNIIGKGVIAEFFNPLLDNDVYNPWRFRMMEQAIALIIKHIKGKDKIVVYGDYDADGVTSSALLASVLRTLKAEVDIYIPDRVSEGYGLNVKALSEIISNGAKLVITVDGGIRNKTEVDYLNENGIDIIITDHHIPPAEAGDLPECLIINAHCNGEEYPEKNLAGVGVAYKLACALIEKSKLEEDVKKKLVESCLDLVAIGTVADCVSLSGENRVLVKRGLEILKTTKRPGLIALKKAAGMKSGQSISSWQIGFLIAPRLNAAGRMDHANTSLNLLITCDKNEAERLAEKLNGNNVDRQKDTEEIFREVEQQIPAQADKKILVGICHLDKTEEQRVWNEGVVGLVAGKIAEKYYRPTLIITQNSEGYKGSGRSIPEFDLIGAIEECGELLDKFGGHKAAAGFSLASDNIDAYIKKIQGIAEARLSGIDLRPKIFIEAEINLHEIEEFFPELLKFEPFGQENEQPKFASYDLKVLDIINMGADGRHLKLRVKDGKSKVYSAVGFGQSEAWSHIRIGDPIDMVYYLDKNEFNGRSEIQLKIIDIKEH